jgi:hypothetical protein
MIVKYAESFVNILFIVCLTCLQMYIVNSVLYMVINAMFR